jgi:hypothetical protein
MTRMLRIAIASAAAAAAALALAAWDPAVFTMDGLKWWPVPTGHQAGKDDGPAAAGGSHHAAEDCGICHAPASAPDALWQPPARNKVFTLTATLMDDRAGRRPAAGGGEILLLDHGGNVVSMTVDALGNAWTQAALAPDPDVGGESDPAAWRYKAWVVAGGVARPMMTIPPVGGMSVPRMSCGMHHVGTGTMGALTASPSSTLRSYPRLGLSFRRHIHPILRSKCAPCHVPGATTASQAGETFDYGGGLDLMNVGGSSVTIEDSTGGSTTYDKIGVADVVSTSDPDASLLLQKTVAGANHGGGAFWTSASADYEAIRAWIAEGAKDN